MGIFSIGRREKKILLLGLQGVGKTTILNRLRYGDASIATQPTIGFNVESITYNTFKFDLWDVGGADKSRATWKELYFHNTRGVVFVVDSTNLSQLSVAGHVLKECDIAMKRKVPFLILVNKQDLDGKIAMNQIEHGLALILLNNKRSIFFLGTSAITGDGFPEAFKWLKKYIWSSMYVTFVFRSSEQTCFYCTSTCVLNIVILKMIEIFAIYQDETYGVLSLPLGLATGKNPASSLSYRKMVRSNSNSIFACSEMASMFCS